MDWRELVKQEPQVPDEPPPSVPLTLVTCTECPFAQRTWLALVEKRLQPHYVFISLRDLNGKYTNQYKPQWFLNHNPNGKVPVVIDNGKAIYESCICNEYLDEAYPDHPLSPRDPYLRAHMRIQIDYFNSKVMPLFYQLLLQQNLEERERIKSQFMETLKVLNAALEKLATQAGNYNKKGEGEEGEQEEQEEGRVTGPYAMGGQQFTLLDIAMLPFFERFQLILKHYRGFAPLTDHHHDDTSKSDVAFDKLNRLREWWTVARERPSFRLTKVLPGSAKERSLDESEEEKRRADSEWDEYMLWVYQAYADNSATSTSASDFRATMAKKD